MASIKPISIQREYEKNPDISPEDISKLRAWLRTQPHLPGEYLTDVDLLVVFHCCEKSFEVTKQVLDLHFTLRSIEETFRDRSIDKKTELSFKTVLTTPLGVPTAEGYRVAYFRLLDSDARNYNFVESAKVFMLMFDLWQYEEGTWPGFIIIVDMEGAVLGHLAKVNINDVKRVIFFLQECMFAKLKGLHFMNAPSFMDKVMAFIKPFLKKELYHLIHFHSVGSETVFKSIPKEGFPKEVGGSHKDFNTLRDDVIKRIKANSAFFEEEKKRRVNESLRTGSKPSQIEKEFGIQGSFKKLDLD